MKPGFTLWWSFTKEVQISVKKTSCSVKKLTCKYVWLDIARCQKKQLDELDPMVPITLESGAPLVVNIGTKKIIWLFFWTFMYLDLNISITVGLIWFCKVPKEGSQWASFNGAYNFGVRCQDDEKCHLQTFWPFKLLRML